VQTDRRTSISAEAVAAYTVRDCDDDVVFRTWLWADQEDEIDLSVMAITESVL
jgi:hypothetical protein